MLSSDKITKIFFVIDEFCKNFSEVPVIGRYLPSFFFNDYEDTDMAHELLHNMGLPHTFQGKTYTEEEWKAFEQEQWGKYQANRNHKSFWERLFG